MEFGVQLGAQCVGDGNPATVDIVLSAIGANGIQGPYGDAIRVMNASPGARGIVLTGDFNCGRGRSGNHQDGVQAIGGKDITWRDMRVGLNGVDGAPSCQGAGGAMFYSSASPTVPQNMRVEGGEFRGCNTGVRAGGGSGQSGHIQDAAFRNGYDESSGGCRDSGGSQYNQGPSCVLDDEPPITVTTQNITCDKWPWD